MKANQKILIKTFVSSSNGVNGWHSKPITHESWHKLIESLNNHGLIGGEIDSEQPFTSDTTNYDYIWHFLDIVGIEPVKIYKGGYEESKSGAMRPEIYKGSDGAFFAYWNNAHQIDLSRYQVMNQNDLFFNQQIHKIPCVFYALELLAKESPDHFFMERLKQVQVQFKWRSCSKGFIVRLCSTSRG